MNKTRIMILVALVVLAMTFAVPAFAESPCDPAVDYFALGTAQYEQEQFDLAIASFTCTLEFHPKSAAAYNARGNAQRNLGRIDQAVADYSQAIELADDFAMAYNNRGWLYYKLGEYDLALADYNRALEIDPNLGYAYNNRGLIFRLKGKTLDAAQDFNRAIDLKIDPINWPQYNLSLLQLGESVQAQGTTTSSTSISVNVNQMLSQAISTYDSRDWSRAVAEFTRIIDLDPENSAAFYLRGRSFIALDQSENALADFERLVELSPNFVYAYWERSIAYAEVGELDKARADAQRAEREAPDHLNNFIAWGTINRLSDDHAGAGKEFLGLVDAYGTERIVRPAIQSGESVTVQMSDGAVYAIPFEGQAGQLITLHAQSQQADALIVLLAPDGKPLSGDDDSCTGLDAIISDFPLPADGTYTLLVSHAGGGSTGPVTVSLSVAATL